ncbi:MAG: hypothetical protein QOJ40_2681, partial [Verrucomicrobiota bacterium]
MNGLVDILTISPGSIASLGVTT